jgi:hypothetical protein
MIRGQRHIQFSYFDGRRELAHNVLGDEVDAKLKEVLDLPFSQIHVQSTTGEMHVRITRRGKALISERRSPGPGPSPLLNHDHVKNRPLRSDVTDPFLQAIGVMDGSGRVRASMWRKFRQINEFLRIMERTLEPSDGKSQPLHAVDCGCGSAYLTFAAFHYLNDILGVPAHVTGIDSSSELVDKCRRLRDSLGWSGLCFEHTGIGDFTPSMHPDMVLSLHACDTATDEAIARGIVWESRVILATPCCQHELHRQLRAPLFSPLLRHGILRERLADLLTDTYRALVLRIMGYRTSVFEFVSPEATSKNLMIRAIKALEAGDTRYLREYSDLKSYWNISPAIENLVGEKSSLLRSA